MAIMATSVINKVKDTANSAANTAADAMNAVNKRFSVSSEINRINTRLNAIKRENQELYTLVGKKAYQAHLDGAEADCTEEFAKIDANAAETAELRVRSADLRGFYICKTCSRECPKDDDFCAKCGTKLEK